MSSADKRTLPLFKVRPRDVDEMPAAEVEALARRCVTRLLALGYPVSFVVGEREDE